MPQSERREALPDHPVPAWVAAPEVWRLRVDGLVVQPLALSISDVDALGAQTHTTDSVCEEGAGGPGSRGTASQLRPSWGMPACGPLRACSRCRRGALQGLCPRGGLTGGALLARRLNRTPLRPVHGAPLWLVAPGRACCSSL
jgi:DMSO/TMAO reductase YedYZ molybdopterin-dependent catalytic subunit